MAVSYEQTLSFYRAIRAERLDVGDAGRRAGLKFHEACEIWSKGVAAGRLRMADDYPGFRYIEEVRRNGP